MGKRLALFIAILFIAGVAQTNLPFATAQDVDCPSGIYSSIDGTCIGTEQSLGIDQVLNNGQSAGATNAYGSATGAGSGAAPSGLAQQYPGLSQGMNGRVQNFRDQSGLPPEQAELDAHLQAQELALQGSYLSLTDFQKLVRASTGKLLPVYGDSLFRGVAPSTFAPLREVNVTPDYVLGPGDQLVIRIWGQVNFNALVTVDRSGSVYLPHVGEIHVAGLPYSQLQQHVRDAIGQIYKNFNVDVEMGQLRSIQVFVVGQARRPGTYTLSSLSTLVTALFATGGPSVEGSLRNIELKRNGQIITHFDLYDLLIFGDMSKDVALLPGDVIFIPSVGPQVAITGSVRNPAIYELKSETTVRQALQFAGGLSATASLLHASLERIDAHKDRKVVDLNLEGAGLQTQLREGDVLRVIPIQPKFEDTVTLRGNVAEPGRFGWRPGMKLSDIIPDSQSLITRDYWERRNQLGIPGPEFKPEYAANPDLFPRTSSEYGQLAPGYNNTATTGSNGQGQSNGSSNPTYSQYNSQATSQNSNDTSGQNCNPSLAPGQGPGGASNSNSPNGAPCTSGGNGAVATGEETSGGNLPRPALKVVLPVPEIDWSYAVIERMNPQTLTTSLVTFNLGELVLDHDPSQDLALEPGDVVTIFSQADIKVPQAQRTKFVRLEGEFNHAGIYSARPGETLRQLVIRAGGLTPVAYLFGSSFTRESTRAVQQVRLNDYIQTLQLDIDRATIAAAANGFSVTASANAASQGLVSRFQAVRATGRIVLNMPPHATNIDSIPDLPLEDGDTFTVPSKPVTVGVVGAVYDQNSFIFQQSRTVGEYLRLAGGPTQSADRGDAFIIRADGSVISRRSQSGVFGNTFAAGRLYPGDTLVVPEKVPKPSFIRNFQTYSQLFSSLALGAAAIAVLQ